MADSKNLNTDNLVLVERSTSVIKHHVIYSAGAGLIPVPLVDMATLLGIQVSMISKIGQVYDKGDDFRKNKVKRSIQILIADLGTFGVFSGVKAIPLIGPLVGMVGAPIYGAASTYALGKVFLTHFDQGGTFLDFEPRNCKRQFKKEYKKGRAMAKEGTLTAALVKTKFNRDKEKATEIEVKTKLKSSSKVSTPITSEKVTENSDKSIAKKQTAGSSKAKPKSKAPFKTKYKDFTIIEGIGPKINELLENAGIKTMEELSKTDVTVLTAILRKAGTRYNVSNPSTWPQQAGLVADENWIELENLQLRLKGGVLRD